MDLDKTTWISYSIISFDQGFITPPKYPAGGNNVFKWNLSFKLYTWEIAWMSTPDSKPNYQQNPGFYYNYWYTNTVDDHSSIGVQRPALKFYNQIA